MPETQRTLDFVDISPERAEFDALFEELTGIDPKSGATTAEGWLLIPEDAALEKKDPKKVSRLAALAGVNGWRSDTIADECSGWRIRRPD